MHLPDLSALPESLQPILEQQWQSLQENVTAITTAADSGWQEQLKRVLVGSDYVAEQLQRRPQLLEELISSGDLLRHYAADDYINTLGQRLSSAEDEASLHRELRRFRQREQVRLIWRDLCRLNDMQATTRELSWLADTCIDQALQWLYRDACKRWGTPYGIVNDGSKQPQQLVVLGMGKLGANELNLSSDIDLIFVYPEKGATEGAHRTLENQDFFIRLGKKLIQALDNQTIDGFVFRVDMRLRPFGSAGPLAISFDAMEGYYQEHGREWERYAMIKARVVAGDQQEGQNLMQILRPFVYRKYIDFSVFDSLREMKEMISREVRRKGLDHNVKLGAGGIREVEFIVQVFQLLRGGRDQRLQSRELCLVLPNLPEWVGMPAQAAEELMSAYIFLRNTEHAIQAQADKQTQELPVDESAKNRLAFSMGYTTWPEFHADLTMHRENVSIHFKALISDGADNDEEQKSNCNQQAWLSLWNDELTAEQAEDALQNIGFDDPQQAWKLLNDLRQSRQMQMLQQIAKERFLALFPLLMHEVCQTHNRTETLTRVFQLVQAVLRRSSYLVLLSENPSALQQLVRLCSASSWFAEKLAQQPILLDELIDSRTLYHLPDTQQLRNELRQQLLRIPEDDTEQLMDALRYFKNAHLLKVAASEITGALPLMKVSDYLTWTAEVILQAVLQMAWRIMTEKHGLPQKSPGQPCDPDFIIVGYGKMGGIELSYGSDLDLVFIHAADPNLHTDGEKSLVNSVFFTRLGQKIIHILNTLTTSGQLYEVDMRLRPSGNAGLLVSSLTAFERYQNTDAWTWEHQALVRARVIAGDPQLKQKFEAVRSSLLSQPRDKAALRQEVVEMRNKMLQHLGSKKDSQFDLKHDRGGIVDIEFLVQYTVLANAANDPSLLTYTDNIRILDCAEASGLLSPQDADQLREAYKAFRSAGHQQALKEQSGVLEAHELSDLRDAVAALWQQHMEPG
ncbi:bifunctional [glutamate--ammonia ligase]-adenylyl-L-tyrosine phosphorylase/[glutamate--ammonia-ligase] adenylyltransferase [Pontibacter sp. JAM-7]|uniref:bifunctional [glutamate--ammonia ligase]-adenylyl-L-tyrosine phosphorylase/[glutamate--ammonia-ligase] adenylyltransferase n=1 Tax=Pontibacter sp. JAM-7 TaxID=3366581 RepID=UPI003AF5C78E